MHFEVYPDFARQWRWSLYSENKKIAESTESYADDEACRRAIASVASSSATPVRGPLELFAEYLGIIY